MACPKLPAIQLRQHGEHFVGHSAVMHGIPRVKDSVRWNIAMRLGKPKLLDKTRLVDDLTDQLERPQAGIRTKVEHSFRVIKRQFDHIRYGLGRSTRRVETTSVFSSAR